LFRPQVPGETAESQLRTEPQNSGRTTTLALKGYELGGIADLPWITENLNVYFLGTEAPDVGPKIAGVANGYHNTGACHWRDAFRNQTGENVNYSANAIAKLLKMI
jgi:hypothetical protein